VKRITCTAVNESEKPIKLKTIVNLQFGDKIISDISMDEFTLDPSSQKILVDNYEIKFPA